MNELALEILSSRSRREVLRFLFRYPGDITGRELARHIGFSHQQAHNALGQLEKFGVVERKVYGPAHLFRTTLSELSAKLKVLLEAAG